MLVVYFALPMTLYILRRDTANKLESKKLGKPPVVTTSDKIAATTERIVEVLSPRSMAAKAAETKADGVTARQPPMRLRQPGARSGGRGLSRSGTDRGRTRLRRTITASHRAVHDVATATIEWHGLSWRYRRRNFGRPAGGGAAASPPRPMASHH